MIKDICLAGEEVLIHVSPNDVVDTFTHRDGPLKMIILDIAEAHKLVDGLSLSLQQAGNIESGEYEYKKEKEV